MSQDKDKVIPVSGIVKRVGYVNGLGQSVELQFMLVNDKNIYKVHSEGKLGLLSVGDNVSFDLKKAFILNVYNVDSYSFKNLSLEKELVPTETY